MRISVLTPTIRPEGLKIVQECLAKQTLQDFEWLVEVGIPERGHDLNASYNRMLKRAKGELMVSLQDYIKIQDNGLELFWQAHQSRPNTFFTAPVGKVLKWEDAPKWDWRESEHANMNWQMWEIDWGCAPMSALKKIGGFDEELDKGWTFDNVNVGYRAHLEGYEFAHLVENKAVAFDHDAHSKHPFREKIDPILHNERLRDFDMGLRLKYIEEN